MKKANSKVLRQYPALCVLCLDRTHIGMNARKEENGEEHKNKNNKKITEISIQLCC